jgi:hypothetical protein
VRKKDFQEILKNLNEENFAVPGLNKAGTPKPQKKQVPKVFIPEIS